MSRETRRFHKIHIVRIERSTAGSQIPFDKLYIFQKKDADIVPRIFKTAMVFPITSHLAEQIKTALLQKGTPMALPKVFAFSRWNEGDLAAEVKVKKLVEEWVEHRQQYMVLIPVLFTFGGSKMVKGDRYKTSRKKHIVYPAYLVAKPNRPKTVQLLRKAMTNRAYFIADGQVARPLCLMCPRHQHFLQGECFLGEENCYKHLSMAKRGDFIRGVMMAEELSKTIDEPELDLKETEV